MNNKEYYIYLAIISLSTYLVRVIPFVAVKEKIKNPYILSFLKYIPYAVLTAMTLPSALFATSSFYSAAAGLLVAALLALKNKSLTIVAIAACCTAFIVELFVL